MAVNSGNVFPHITLSGRANAIFGDVHIHNADTTAQAAGLAATIITFLDLTSKVLSRAATHSRDTKDVPTYFRVIEQQLPLLEKTLHVIKRQALSSLLAPDLCSELVQIVLDAREETNRLYAFICLIKPPSTSKAQKFSMAVRSVMQYDDKVEQILEKLISYTNTLSLLQSTATGQQTDEVMRRLHLVKDDQIDVMKQQEQENIRKWVDGLPRDSFIDSCLAKTAPDTCEWVLQVQAYKQWQSSTFSTSDPKILWLHGPPGFGKTFMAASILMDIEQLGIASAVFWTSEAKFANATLSEITRSWLAQLLVTNPEYCDYVKPVRTNSKAERASAKEVRQALKAVLSSSKASITLVLDGLDEYSHQQAQRLGRDSYNHQQNLRFETVTDFLKSLKSTLRGTRCRFLCVSQPQAEIRSQLTSSQLVEDGFKQVFEHGITKDDVEQDITALAKHIIQTKLPKKNEKLKEELAKMVSEKAEGSMLWIALQPDNLRPSFSESKCRKVIEETPTGLESIYQVNLDRISRLKSDDNERALRILNWVMHGLRPLTVHEMVEALLIEDNDDFEEIAEDELPDDPDEEDVYGELVKLCGNYIAFDIDEERSAPRYWKIRFAHSSIRAFLTKRLSVADLDQQARQGSNDASEKLPMLGALCARYVLCKNIWPSIDAEAILDSVCLTNHPFLAYAASYFSLHVDKSNRLVLEPIFRNFYLQQYEVWDTWRISVQKVKDFAWHGLAPSRRWNWKSKLQFAAALGFKQVVDELCELDEFSTASQLAPGFTSSCWYGDMSIILFLLSRGADVNTPGVNGYRALHAASWVGEYSLNSVPACLGH